MLFQIVFLLQVVHSLGQIISNDKLTHRDPIPNLIPDSNHQLGLELAVTELTKSVSQISSRLSQLESKIDNTFQLLTRSQDKEQDSLTVLDTKLNSLNSLADRVYKLDSKINNETELIKSALRITNIEVQRLSTQFENIEDKESEFLDAEPAITMKDASKQRTNNSTTNSQRNGENRNDIVDEVRNILPRILASELNHFYLSMSTRMDQSLNQLQREFTIRLRRIETNTKNSLTEIQNGRQDISHLTHLTRSARKSCSSNSNPVDGILSQIFTEVLNVSEFHDFAKAFQQNISTAIVQKLSESQNYLALQGKNISPKNTPDISTESSPINSELWKDIFPRSLAVAQSPGKFTSQKNCIDFSTLDAFEEVKQLLKTLVSKGEDLKQTLTEQAAKGVDLLQLLHQRFSVLLRRMNTDPNHAEALMAEVQELEHLVENSYSSILIAQNLFIESCQRIQQQQPTLEGQIVEILNRLVTNIDLGHQFNRKQLQDVRKIIERIAEQEEAADLTFFHSWTNSGQSSTNINPTKDPQLVRDAFFSHMVRVVAKANATEGKLKKVVDRISSIESEVEAIGWNANEFKNVADELLTGAKDLKGFSKDQMISLKIFQEEVVELVELYAEFRNSLNNNSTGEFLSSDSYIPGSNLLPEKCSLQLLHQILDIDSHPIERLFNETDLKSKKSLSKKGGVVHFELDFRHSEDAEEFKLKNSKISKPLTSELNKGKKFIINTNTKLNDEKNDNIQGNIVQRQTLERDKMQQKTQEIKNSHQMQTKDILLKDDARIKNGITRLHYNSFEFKDQHHKMTVLEHD